MLIKQFSVRLQKWWKKHIVSELPPDEDEEFSEKYR
jgi:hypothetical protein